MVSRYFSAVKVSKSSEALLCHVQVVERFGDFGRNDVRGLSIV